MKKLFALSCAAATLLGISSLSAVAGPPAKDKTPKVTDVKHCPMTGEEVKDMSGKSEVVGKYRVHFCCAGCDSTFDKLTKKDKEAKIKDALKKDKEAEKKG